jgi:arylformamidase
MAAIDYETEYNNRARVPEHEEIFARWAREAELYRVELLKADRAELGLAYGDTPRQFIDLFRPAFDNNSPLAVFVHGGYWRSLDPSLFSQMARGMNTHGITVAVVGYDLCPMVGIADIVEQIRHACLFLWQRLHRTMLVSGWSAGGHLAAAMVATDWAALYPKAPADLVPAGFAISGVYDLVPLISTSMNQDLRLDDEEARALSPQFWRLPSGRTFDTTVGALESSEFRRQNAAVADAWRQQGAQTQSGGLAGMNHFTAPDVLADPKSATVARIVALAQRLKA